MCIDIEVFYVFQLSNHLFEELAMDVYDEVDRRENDSVWLSTHDHTSIVSDRQAVPFLPVNPEFSATRNQVCIYVMLLFPYIIFSSRLFQIDDILRYKWPIHGIRSCFY